MRIPGTCVAKMWWYQEVLDLTRLKAAAAIEEKRGGEYMEVEAEGFPGN